MARLFYFIIGGVSLSNYICMLIVYLSVSAFVNYWIVYLIQYEVPNVNAELLTMRTELSWNAVKTAQTDICCTHIANH